MSFDKYTLRMLTEDRDAAIVRRDREQKLINELESHIKQHEMKLEQKGAQEASIGATKVA